MNLTATSETLPLADTASPNDQQQLAELVKECFESETAVYPIGGGTSVDYGLPAKRDGIGLSLAGLSQVIDYPARDMTITVEAGITMQALAGTLAQERQQLPIDVPQDSQATLGGVVATNFNGPRRYGLGTVRDYVIGIRAVDGRGLHFKGGGRVVKNVAGYDFCKLLTGSLGTLGVITELTLKLKPLPDQLAIASCGPTDLEEAEKLLAALVHTQTTPSAIELLSGPNWRDTAAFKRTASKAGLLLAVAVEGTAVEVDWMLKQLGDEWRDLGVASPQVVRDDAAASFMRSLAEFPAAGDSPLVLQASLTPSGTTTFIEAVREVDQSCSIQAHAGNGIVLVQMSEFPPDGLAKTVVGKLQSVAGAAHGHVVVLSNPSGAEMTRQGVWGAIDAPFELMTTVKQEFDPKNILNPDRFVYHGRV
jgi:glycolate oxidase FAD binding subunit